MGSFSPTVKVTFYYAKNNFSFLQVYELHDFYMIIFTQNVYLTKLKFILIGIADIMFRTCLFSQGQSIPLPDVFVSWMP